MKRGQHGQTSMVATPEGDVQLNASLEANPLSHALANLKLRELSILDRVPVWFSITKGGNICALTSRRAHLDRSSPLLGLLRRVF